MQRERRDLTRRSGALMFRLVATIQARIGSNLFLYLNHLPESLIMHGLEVEFNQILSYSRIGFLVFNPEVFPVLQVDNF